MIHPEPSLELVDNKQLTPNTSLLSFHAKKVFTFEPGQFIQLLFDVDQKQYKRSYSVANTPEDYQRRGIIEIAISFVEGGVASTFFRRAEPGVKVGMRGPFGILTLPEQWQGRIILAGTGTGMAPYCSMSNLLQKLTESGTRAVIISGVRKRSDRLFDTTFRELATNSTQIDYHNCLSREATANQSDNEHLGYIPELFPKLTLNPESDLIYLCGNPNMVDDSAARLLQYGFPVKQVKREKYVFSK